MKENNIYIFKKSNIAQRFVKVAFVLVATKYILQWLCPVQKIVVTTTKITEDTPVETTGEE